MMLWLVTGLTCGAALCLLLALVDADDVERRLHPWLEPPPRDF
jgi:hypothetical protein